MFKILLRSMALAAVGLSIAAVVTMTANKSEAQGGSTTPGALRPIRVNGVGNVQVPHPAPGNQDGTIGAPIAPAMPGYVPNPGAIRTPGNGFNLLGTSPGTPGYDPAGIATIQAGALRPTLRPGNFSGVANASTNMGQQGQQGGIGGGIGGQQGGIGGIGGQGIGGQGGGVAGAAGVGGIGGGGTILGGGVQQQLNFQGGVIFPGNGFGAIGVIQVPTVGFPAQQQVQGGFGGGIGGGGQIQGGIGGQIQGGIGGGIGGIGGGIGGIGGIGGQGGKIGFAGYYGL